MAMYELLMSKCMMRVTLSFLLTGREARVLKLFCVVSDA